MSDIEKNNLISSPTLANKLILDEDRLKLKSEELCNRNLLPFEQNHQDQDQDQDQIKFNKIENSILIDGDPSSWSQITSKSENKKNNGGNAEEIRKQSIIDVDKCKIRLEEIDLPNIDPVSLS